MKNLKTDDNSKIILDLCGGTGAWSRPYKESGYKVFNLTLPEFDITLWGVHKGYLYFPSIKTSLNDLRIEIKDIYGVLAAPPCTEFSKAKSTQPRKFKEGMKVVRACLEIIWEIQEVSKLNFWALENPEGLLSRFLGNPPYTFEQWWFGNNRSKRTQLWGRFKEPKRIVFEKPSDYARAAHNRNADWFSNSTAEKRAVTPEGFARAFLKANR